MVNVAKWGSFGYCVEDGKKDPAKLTADQKLRKIDRVPNFFEYFSYMTFFTSSILGPGFDYYDFRLFLSGQDVYGKVPFFKSILESLKMILKTLIYMAIVIFLVPRFPVEYTFIR